MKKLVFCGTICLLISMGSNLVNAQAFKLQLPPGYNKIVEGAETPGVTGSQYLSDEWVVSSISFNDSSTIDSIKLRLNAFKGEMQYYYQNTEYVIGAPDDIKRINMGARVFIYEPYLKDGSFSNNYFEVLVDGKTQLLVLYSVSKRAATYNKALDTGEKNERLELKEQIYIKKGMDIIELDKKGKELIKLMGGRSDELLKQIDNEDLSFKKKADLIKIISYLNDTI